MEQLLDTIEAVLLRRPDYLQHQRFGERIVFETTNGQIHWIRIDTYTIDSGGGADDFPGPPILKGF